MFQTVWDISGSMFTVSRFGTNLHPDLHPPPPPPATAHQWESGTLRWFINLFLKKPHCRPYRDDPHPLAPRLSLSHTHTPPLCDASTFSCSSSRSSSSALSSTFPHLHCLCPMMFSTCQRITSVHTHTHTHTPVTFHTCILRPEVHALHFGLHMSFSPPHTHTHTQTLGA